MSRWVFSTLAVVGLVGCASQPSGVHSQVKQPGKFVSTQVATPVAPEFVLCRDEACKDRTTKVIALPKPSASENTRVAPLATPQPDRIDRYAVHFRVGQHRLDTQGMAEITEVIQALKRRKSVKKIDIAGRTDPTGSLKFNQRLALLRAEEVKRHLESSGFDSALMTVQAHSPCCDGDLAESPEQMQARRRADIQVVVTY
jgi:outer membrane protein OmpA-like peptidoglycan-associated protein